MSGLAIETDVVMPRVCHVPEAVDWSIGDDAVVWAREHKMTLDLEQEMMLRSMFGLRDDGLWQSFEFGVNAPRQNGKGNILMARELFGMFVLGEMLIVHSAHEFKTSARHFQRLEQVIRANVDLLVQVERSELGTMRLVGFRYSHGDEAITLQNGAKIEFRTRTKSGLKGVDDVALLVLDEAQILSEWAHGTMVPTLRASTAPRGPQLVYAGNAVDQERDDHAVVWTRVRERALEGDDDSLVYHEYSLDFDSPEEVPEDVIVDEDAWRQVNWAMGRGRVRVDHMRKELRSLGYRQFMVELLGVGDYPDTDLVGNPEISLEEWADCEDGESRVVDPVVFGFDVSPARRTTIVACGLNEHGKLHIEVVKCQAGTGWVPAWFEERCGKHEVLELVCDGFGPANTIAHAVEEQTGLKVRRLKTGEYAVACGMLANEIAEKNVIHIGQEELSTAVRGARTRPLVDRWAWSRSKSKTDPGPIIAGSIALWSAVDRDIANSEVVIY
jgi:hypothetical protein